MPLVFLLKPFQKGSIMTSSHSSRFDSIFDWPDKINLVKKTISSQFDKTKSHLDSCYKDLLIPYSELDLIFKRLDKLEREIATFIESKEKSFHFLNLRKRYHDLSLKLRAEEVDNFGYDPVFANFVSPFFQFLFEDYWRIQVFGLENVPSQGRCLFVGNHSGSIPYDAAMVKTALQPQRDLRFLVEDFLFHLPFLGSLMNRFGGVRASQDNAEKILEQELPLMVFPEGIKGLGKLHKDRYQLQRFGRGGFIKLCLRTRAPLIPVAIIGAEEIHPLIYKETSFAQKLGFPYFPITWTFPWLGPLGLIPLPSRWSIHILPPIDFSSYGEGAENDRMLVYKKSKEVKELLQETLNKELKKRESVWF